MTRIAAAQVTCFILVLLFLIPSYNTNSIMHYANLEISDFESLETGFELAQQPILQDEALIKEILSFVQTTQNDGDVDTPSMDIAYYLGMSLYYLDWFGFTPPASIVAEVLDLVNSSRNDDGGYGNWNGARSSVESTYQALQILSTYNALSSLPESQVNETVNFLLQLKTVDFGYLPLPLWDAPDVSSTHRVVHILDQIGTLYPSFGIQLDNSSVTFINSTFVPPLFVNGASGFSENIGGQAELLASLNALQAFLLMNTTESSRFESVARFLNSLVAISGGVAGYAGGLPTMGYTTAAVQLWHLFKTETSFPIDDYLPITFLEDALNYILANQEAGSGFTASDRDATAELSSSFFALRLLFILDEHGLLITIPDLTGVYNYLISGTQPSFGFGNYPGDVPDISYSAYALLIGNLLANTSWVNPAVKVYIEDAYSNTRSGFGFRPGTTARVKYTYFGIRATRSLDDPLTATPDIIQFILNSQNEVGGFGEQPGSTISYLTHTYWAISALNLLGDLQSYPMDINSIFTWLSYLEKPDGTYSNFPGLNSTLTSTYRAIMVRLMLGGELTTEPIKTTLSDFQNASGGFVPSRDRVIPTMESTFYGVALSLLLNISLDESGLVDFIYSLHNNDGGFGPRQGYSSRLESTFYAILTLNLLNMDPDSLSVTDLSENPLDLFSPIIVPTFIPGIENYRKFQNSYALSSIILDPESLITDVWVEADWTSDETGVVTPLVFDGHESETYQNEWIFLMGNFYDDGILRFRIHANDSNGNSAVTEYLYLTSIAGISPGGITALPLLGAILPWILPVFFLIGGFDSYAIYRRKRKTEGGQVQMTLKSEKRESLLSNESLNLIALFVVFGSIAALARFFIHDAILVLETSLFLFRFMIGMIIILVGKYVFGLKTLGLFGPTILVISMLALGPVWGLLIFLNIFVIGYIIRSILSQFNLAIGFRIGILMIYTISFIGLLEILGEVFLIPLLSGSILVPILITPWFIDRYVVEAEQEDQLTAFKRLVTTLGISLASFIFMSIDILVTFIVVNPELWVVLAASVLYFGRNTKYTSFDHKRFTRLFEKGENPLSIQIRNRNYIAKYNSGILFSVINKYNLKDQFDKWRVPTAELYALVDSENQVDDLMHQLKTQKRFENGFVIKPAQSFGGKGILVVKKRDENGNFISGTQIYNPIVIETEIRKIIKGEYLTSQTKSNNDIVIIEELITTHPSLERISIGLPDIRVIIFRGIPVMAMMRLSTEASDGLANLKQGAIGAAVRISDGRVTRAEMKGLEVQKHPDTGGLIVGFELENWSEILATACLAQKSTGLGYAGVDIVIDKNDRILVLEVNKRPGLEIQNVCQSSLLERFEYIENHGLDASELSPSAAARYGVELAQNIWEQEAI
ncbi:MAG: sugar-transfer associated ATP-grasp domain-containing protein [Candidatus Thorarchaeota archaeon]